MGRGRLRAFAFAALGAALLLSTACGGDEPAAVSTVTTTVTETVTSTVSETAPTNTSGPTEPEPKLVAFQMPSRNIGCLFGFRQLRCDILSGLVPEPTEECDFDWVGVDMA